MSAPADGIDLGWRFTQLWPGDPTMTEYVPPIGEHVLCYRPSDGKTECGTVDDNRCGLFLSRCHGDKVVMTAALWLVQPIGITDSCRTNGTYAPPVEGDRVT